MPDDRMNVGFQFGDVRGTATFAQASTGRHAPTSAPGDSEAPAATTGADRHSDRPLSSRASAAVSRHRTRDDFRLAAKRSRHFDFRDATSADIPALARLHVKTWASTYPGVRHPPTFEIRESQWNEAFQNVDGTWFAIVIEKPNGELVGFAKGVRHENGVGDLNKIYLLTEYQRLGLGRRLVGHVARRFLAMGQSSMSLSADAANPSCHFYHALGAENPREPDGRVHRGAFVWPDLEALAARCPTDS